MLDIVSVQQRRTKTSNHLLVVRLDLPCLGDIKLPQLRLEVAVHLKLEKSLRDVSLELVGLSAPAFHYLGASREHLECEKSRINKGYERVTIIIMKNAVNN